VTVAHRAARLGALGSRPAGRDCFAYIAACFEPSVWSTRFVAFAEWREHLIGGRRSENGSSCLMEKFEREVADEDSVAAEADLDPSVASAFGRLNRQTAEMR
jgi:hypothetical protein